MNVLVLYDSYFGNTEKVARAISDALAESHQVETRRVSEADPKKLDDVELLIIGSPTRAFQATKAATQFIQNIPRKAFANVRVAAFDTRIEFTKDHPNFLKGMVKTFGYAAEPLAKKLTKKGGTLVVPAEGFFVDDTEGPVTKGELARAAAWALKLTE